MKSVLEFDHEAARRFFLKEESYFNFDLPHYFKFKSLIDKVAIAIDGKKVSEFYNTYKDEGGKDRLVYPSEFEDVNYKFLNNKDGKFAWRPFQLIHPVLYVFLVNTITEKANWQLILDRFKEFRANSKIKCQSIPVESEDALSDKATTITGWWHSIEQKSLELAIDFEYVLHTDITDCYGSIYTHSISWALHTKAVAKDKRKDMSLVGNSIDRNLQNMSFGQTNGIPQGSALMDFIAEMVLGFTDLELSNRIAQRQIEDYQIIRYRDDYRIFSNNPQDAEYIAKLLTEILIEQGMRLNAHKTVVSNNLIRDSIKPDKLHRITSVSGRNSLQEHLLIIHDLSEKFPNSGSVSRALNLYFNRIKGLKKTKHNIQVLISILIDIAYKNPRTYPIISAILSKLLSLIDVAEIKEKILSSISKRFDRIPNTAHIKIWLQRVTIKIDRTKTYDERLCEKVNDNGVVIWNSDWLRDDLKKLVSEEPIVDEQTVNGIDVVIDSKEVQLFGQKSDYPAYAE